MRDVTSSGLTSDTRPTTRVTVTDIDMPFWSMVMFMFKWAVATIPALLLLGLLAAVLIGVLEGIARSL